MKIVTYILLAVLAFLAISSGLTKGLLMERDVEFFAPYGFTNAILMVYGFAQVAGGILLLIPRSRVIGAAIVAISFLISAVVLAMSGDIPMTVITLVCIALLGLVIRKPAANGSDQAVADE